MIIPLSLELCIYSDYYASARGEWFGKLTTSSAELSTACSVSRMASVAQWLEHLVVVQRVAGSIPVARPIRLRPSDFAAIWRA